jgi:SAM-dependent methyltransferase
MPVGALELAHFPHVYDAAFSWDRAQEARTYLDIASFYRGGPARFAAELACGTGPLARRWAAEGVDVYGVDHCAAAVIRARELSRGIVPAPHWIRAELKSFRLPRPVELAAVPLDSLGYLVEERELVSFFRSAGRSLLPGAVLAVDLTLHPEGGPALPIRNEWEVSLRPQGVLRVSWRSQGRTTGRPPRRWEVGQITVTAPDGSSQLFWEARPHSVLDAPTLENLAQKAGGFGEMEVYSDAAHRAGGVEIHRLAKDDPVEGPRLICWVRN